MAQRESSVRRRILDVLRAHGAHAFAVENSAMPGTPDIHYTMPAGDPWLNGAGWIECKQLDRWPARSTTALCIPHFTPQQRSWLRAHERSGGRAHVIVRISRGQGGEWVVINGAYAADYLGLTVTEETIRGGAHPNAIQLLVSNVDSVLIRALASTAGAWK